MIFSSKAEYGVRLMVEFGLNRQPRRLAVISLKAIAAAENLPLAYLEQVVARLKKGGAGQKRPTWRARRRPACPPRGADHDGPGGARARGLHRPDGVLRQRGRP